MLLLGSSITFSHFVNYLSTIGIQRSYADIGNKSDTFTRPEEPEAVSVAHKPRRELDSYPIVDCNYQSAQARKFFKQQTSSSLEAPASRRYLRTVNLRETVH